MSKLEELKNEMRKHGLRVTNSRVAIATVLINNSQKFLTPEQIHNKVLTSKKLDCDFVSVYRTLSKFEELGIVNKNSFNGEAARYSLNICCDNPNHDHAHQHFFKCKSCHKIEPLNECTLTQMEKDLAKAGYTELNHHVEITGICPNCSN